MAVDFVARATAAAARSIANRPVAELFNSLGSRSAPLAANAIMSHGFDTAGRGAALYVSDGLATAALGAAHPRFCKADSTGRWFRLAGAAIEVEQGGATGVPGTNDQPAIQAAITYAAAVGIGEVRFRADSYDLWCPLRTAGIAVQTLEGIPLVVGGNVDLIGTPRRTRLQLKGPTGGARGQSVAGGVWYGGMLIYSGAAVTRSVLRNLEFDGGLNFANVLTNAESNVSDKGVLFNDGFAPNLVKIDHRDCTMHNFAGEIWYMGGSFTACEVHVENLVLHTSPQCCWNPGALAKVTAINLDCSNSYQPAETISGSGHTYLGGRFHKGSTLAFIGTDFFNGHYAIPNRDVATPIKGHHFIGTRFDSAGLVNFGNWTRGSIVTVDTPVLLGSETSLDIESWCDTGNGNASATITGPGSAIETYPGSSSVVPPTANLDVRVICKRTKAAADAGRGNHGIEFYASLFDANSVRGRVEGAVRNAFTVTGSSFPTGFAIPRIVVGPTQALEQPYGGTYDYPAADTAYKIRWSAMTFYPSAAGTKNITLDMAWGYADGQEVTFYHGGGGSGDRIFAFAQNGAGMSLKETRLLRNAGDYLRLRYNGFSSKWVELEYGGSRMSGSKSYDAPAVATGASVSTTVAVTGALLGDQVTAVSLGVDTTGLTVTGAVTATDTVTVTIVNVSGGSINLAAATLKVEVARP